MRRSVFTLAIVCMFACKGEPIASGTTWPEADALFHSNPRWLGADGAYSVDLGKGRILWMFGDSFVAQNHADANDNPIFLRNTVALETGTDPSRATIGFYWGAADDGGPRSFLDQDGADWFWPGGGARIDDLLVLFYGRIHTPSDDPNGFEQIGWRAVLVDDPDDEPSAWNFRDATLPADSKGLGLANAILLNGAYVYAYAESNDELHPIYLARWNATDAANGDLSAPQWWCGSSYDPACASPAKIISSGAPELSVHADGRIAPFVMVQTEGYGATTLAIRTAPAPEGPWSDPQSFFRPPESNLEDAFIYAGKAHPELTGADLVATYVPTTFGSNPDPNLYHPHFVRITYP